MVENIKSVNNPLTIIAIFAGLAEVSGTVVLAFLPLELQLSFIWFVMFFPSGLVLIFFAILLFNRKILYAPSDFKNDTDFTTLLLQKSNTSTKNTIIELQSIANEENIDFIHKKLNEIKNSIIDYNKEMKSLSLVANKHHYTDKTDYWITPPEILSFCKSLGIKFTYGDFCRALKIHSGMNESEAKALYEYYIQLKLITLKEDGFLHFDEEQFIYLYSDGEEIIQKFDKKALRSF